MRPEQQIGRKLSQRRKALGLRMKDIAGTDFTVSFISQIESGKVNPSVPSLEIIAARLAVPMSYFFADTGHEKNISSIATRDLLVDFFALDNLLKAKDYHKLGKLLEEIKNKLRDGNLPELVCLCDYYESVAIFNSGDKTAAATIVQKVLPQLEDNTFPDKLVNCHNILARAYRQQGNNNAAVLGFKTCIEIISAHRLVMPDIEIGAWLQLGEIAMLEGDVFEAYNAWQNALRLASVSRWPLYAEKAHNGLAECYSRTGYPDKSAVQCQIAADIRSLLDKHG